MLRLGNLVWHDRNNNGLVDGGEEGIPNIIVQLFRTGDNPLTALPLQSDTTDAAGHYRFANLPAGRYFVYLPTPPHAYPWSSTRTDTADNGEDNDDNGSQTAFGAPVRSPVIDLANNLEPTTDGDDANGDQTVDFGFFAPASLGDFVWYDADRDGIQDQNETGMAGTTAELGVPGVIVSLYDAVTNLALATTTTDAHGRYLFAKLVPGRYYVQFTPLAGYFVSPANQEATDSFDSDVDVTTLRTPETTLRSGDYNPSLDLGLYLTTNPISIGNRVWYDRDRDGIQDQGESGVPGVPVTLYRVAGSTRERKGDIALVTTTTDGNGDYWFAGLPPGDYYLIFQPFPGYHISPQDAAGADTLDSDGDPTTGRTALTTLVAGENDQAWDLGLYSDTLPAAMGDYVWFDSNGNGLQDQGESGIPGVVVTLSRGDGTSVVTTRTDADGYYYFINLLPGDYAVALTPLPAYVGTRTNQGANGALDSDAAPLTGRTAVTTLVAGENDPTWDAGFFLVDERTGNLLAPAGIGDRVWIDLNRNGLQDNGEPNAVGITVKLYTSTGLLVALDLTDANGLYGFHNLPPGAYYVEMLLPPTYSYSPLSNLTNSNLDSNADPNTGRTSVVTLRSGLIDLMWDTGLYQTPTELRPQVEPTLPMHTYLPLIVR